MSKIFWIVLWSIITQFLIVLDLGHGAEYRRIRFDGTYAPALGFKTGYNRVLRFTPLSNPVSSQFAQFNKRSMLALPIPYAMNPVHHHWERSKPGRALGQDYLKETNLGKYLSTRGRMDDNEGLETTIGIRQGHSAFFTPPPLTPAGPVDALPMTQYQFGGNDNYYYEICDEVYDPFFDEYYEDCYYTPSPYYYY